MSGTDTKEVRAWLMLWVGGDGEVADGCMLTGGMILPGVPRRGGGSEEDTSAIKGVAHRCGESPNASKLSDGGRKSKTWGPASPRRSLERVVRPAPTERTERGRTATPAGE